MNLFVGKKKTIHLHLILHTFRQSSEQAVLWGAVAAALCGCPLAPSIRPLYGIDPHDGTETARTPWLHGDDLIRSIRAPLPKAAGLVDLYRVTNY